MINNQLFKSIVMSSSLIGTFHIQGIKISLIFFLSLFSLLGQNTLAQAPIEWQFTAGGTDNDRGRKLVVTDGGLIVIGHSSSSDFGPNENQGEKDAVILKIDQDGNTLWQYNYGGSNEDVIWDIKETPDQGFIAVGYSRSNDGDLSENNGGQDYWIFKIDGQGALQWTKTYGGTNDDKALSVYVTEDGGTIVAGDSKSNDGDVSGHYGEFNYDCWVIRLDSDGNLIWGKNYGGGSNEYTASIIQLADEGYLLVSGTESEDFDVSNNYSTDDSEDIWVVRIDDEGGIIWEKNFGGSGEDSPENVLIIDEENILICGRTTSSSHDFINQGIGGNDGFVMQINIDGDVTWTNLLGGAEIERITAIAHSTDGIGYIFSGFSESSDGDVSENYGEWDAWLGKLSNSGELIWEQNYGGTEHDRAESIVVTEEGHILFTGYTSSSDIDIEQNNGSEDFWVVCLESSVSTEMKDNIDQLDLNLFPNPANDLITIVLGDLNAIVQCDITNASGQLLKKVQLTKQNTVVDISAFATGIYSLRVLSETTPKMYKIVVY